MLVKDPVLLDKLMLKELEGMSDEALTRHASMFGVDLSQSLKRDNPSHKKESVSEYISQSTKKRSAIQNEKGKK